jgi:formate dehydrogenase major subunit
MACLNITINGAKVEAQAGQTVLEAAQANGIDIPVLCHHPALAPQGSCRMCLVEVEKQRNLQPACTFPVTDGMVVNTESEKVVSARRFVLELLFSERNHYCMYCAMSGSEEDTDCELQRLAYRYGLSHWKFEPNTKKRWPVDASRKYFFMDHSRCILCRRCVRACDEIVANHTLGVRERGARTMIIADADVPFGESTCVSCGTCLQVCPTGALIDRRSAYMGHHTAVEKTATTCMACPVGCGIQAVTASNQLLRVEGDWDAANAGLLCVAGRFEVVEPQPERITEPMVRVDGQWQKATWDEALNTVTQRLTAAGPVAGLATPRATSEALAAFACLFEKAFGTAQVGLLYGAMPPAGLGASATLADLSAADYIVVVNGEPLQDQMVLGYIAKRAVDNGARLAVVSDTETGLDPMASLCVPVERLAEVVPYVEAAVQPVVLYGAGLDAAAYQMLAALPAKTRFMPLYKGTNAAGAAQMGLSAKDVQGGALFVLAGDDVPDKRTPACHALPHAEFTVVQAAYRTAWTEAADVVLPAQVWTERAGHVVNVEGRQLPVVPITQAPAGVQADEAALALLADRLGHPLN